MSLKYKFSDLFRGKFPIPKKLYDCLESLADEIDDKPFAKPIVVQDVTVGKRALKKAFGKPEEFENIGVVCNSEGAYIIVSDGKKFYYYALNEV